MSFTLSQFKAALGQNAEAAAENTVQFASKAWDTTKSTATKTGSAVKGVMPATNKKVDNIAAKFNSRLNSVEVEQRVHDVWFSQLSQATGVQLADKEDVIEALLEADKEEEATKKAAETAKKMEAVAKAVVNPELVSVLGMFAEKFLGVNPFEVQQEDEEEDEEDLVVEVRTEVIDESEVPEHVKAKAKVKPKAEKPKKEEEEGVSAPLKGAKKSGRKKLGMSAPLAD